jgi:hypothetical protein
MATGLLGEIPRGRCRCSRCRLAFGSLTWEHGQQAGQAEFRHGEAAGQRSFVAKRIGSYVRQHHLALLCLFLILGGGTAWALENNSVKSRHIVNGQVKDPDLSAGIPRGVEVVEDLSVSDSADKDGQVECPDGKVAIGGGARAPVQAGFVALRTSIPATTGLPTDLGFEGWYAEAIEVNGGTAANWRLTLYAICARL